MPPGGGLEGEGSLLDCAVRETWEETGLEIVPDRFVYLRQFVQGRRWFGTASPLIHHLEIFIACRSFIGDPTVQNVEGRGDDEHYLRTVEPWSRDEVRDLGIYPEQLKDSFWTDLAQRFPSVTYLGVTFD